jgi:hypothetical protein
MSASPQNPATEAEGAPTRRITTLYAQIEASRNTGTSATMRRLSRPLSTCARPVVPASWVQALTMALGPREAR